MPASQFRVARNPDPSSRLPFVLALPVAGEREVVLACAADWPGVKDAYCHPLDAWPAGAEILAEVAVESCRRVGQAIHLVLRRRQRRRSMFVWTWARGRTAIFWRTPATMAAARPGLKVMPARGLDRPLEIAVDARERYAWRFGDQPARLVRRELPVGDYGVFDGDLLCAVVERKRAANLASDAVAGQLGFVLGDLERVPYACIVVDGRLSDVVKAAGEHVTPGWLLSVLAALQTVHPRVPVIYAETRDLAEDYAFRWLAAARRRHFEVTARPCGEAGAIVSPPLPGLFDGEAQALRATSRVRARGGAAAPGVAAGRGERGRIAESGRDAGAPQQGVPLLDRIARQTEALRQAHAGRVWTAADYAEAFGVSRPTAWLDLKALVADASLTADGSRRHRVYVAPRPRSERSPD